jgi:hypothetical protein
MILNPVEVLRFTVQMASGTLPRTNLIFEISIYLCFL